MMKYLPFFGLLVAVNCTAVSAEEWKPEINLSVDHLYGIPPHTVRFRAALTGPPIDFQTPVVV